MLTKAVGSPGDNYDSGDNGITMVISWQSTSDIITDGDPTAMYVKVKIWIL